MKRLIQELNTVDDSFSYTVAGESEPTYKVDSHGYLTEKGKEIGKFRLIDNHWYLYLDNVTFPSIRRASFELFKLPEFELKVLTELINR